MQSVLHHCHLYHVSMCNSWQIHPSICPCVCPMLVLFLSESIYCHTSMPVCQGIISVFIEPHPATTIRKFQGEPSSVGALNTRLGEFYHYRFVSREWYRIGPWLLWINSRKSQIADQAMSVPVTLKDRTRGVKIFWWISIITLIRFYLE